MRRLAVLAPVALALALALAPATARANSRYPASVSVSFRPGNDKDIYLGATFGLIISHDDGGHFSWICENALGYTGNFDPKYEVARDGTIYATNFKGLMVSRDGGCTFALATAELPVGDPGRFADIWVDAIDLGPSDEVWVATAEDGKENEVYRSTDGGRVFQPMGMRSNTIWWKSIRVAPSNPQRVYLTGYQLTQEAPDGGIIPPSVYLYRTDDGGAHWAEMPITGITLSNSPVILISEVSPTNPDILWVRSIGAARPAGDRLFRSADGGQTWTEVLVTEDALRAMVVRADGTAIAGTPSRGAFLSTDGGETFQPLATPPQMSCLGERDDHTLFSCGANFRPDFFSLGRSTDGETWTKVFRFVDITAPLSCPAGTIQHDTCELRMWSAIKRQFGIRDPVEPDAGSDMPPKPAGCCDAGGQGGATALLVGLTALGLLVPRRRRS